MSKAPGSVDFEAELGALLPAGVGVAVWSEGMGVDALGPQESAAIARAVPRRRLEFARGRTCARRALRRAGMPGGATAESFPEIPVGPSRSPVWPAGFTGSITHCEGLVAAVCAPMSLSRGLGLDAEPDVPLPMDVIAQIVTPEEARAEDDRHMMVRFSAKESIHKAVFPLTGIWLDFLDVSLELGQGLFRARPAAGARTQLAEVSALQGRYARVGGLVVTVAWV